MKAKFYLLFSAAGLFPVALSYGIAPGAVLPKVLNVAVEGTDLTHILRGVMGLYLGMIVFWILGALRSNFTQAAVMSEIVFMFGLAVGRMLSIVVDGVPSLLLIAYTALEIGMGVWGLMVLKGLSAGQPA